MKNDSDPKFWRGANGAMLGLFAFGAIVQVNDPDPLPWMLVYGAAAAACLLAMLRRARWWFPAAVAAACIVWAATIAPRVIGQVPFRDMFGAFEMKDTGVEESREMYGLFLIALWMVVIARRAWREAARRA